MLTFSGSSQRPATPQKMDISLKTLAENFKALPDALKERIIPQEALVQDILDLRKPETPEEAGKQIARIRILEQYPGHSRKVLANNLKELPPELNERIMPPRVIVRDILAMRQPQTHEEAAKQLVRFRFLESCLHNMPTDQQTHLLHTALRKNHPAFFHFLLKHATAPDMPVLLRTAVQTRNDEAFQGLLQRMPVPIPAESLNETLACLAHYGQPEKLEQLLTRQPEAHRPQAAQLQNFRHVAREQSQKIRQLAQLPTEEAKVKLFDHIKGRRLFPTAFPLTLAALLQTPHLDINEPNQEDGVSETALEKAIRMDDTPLFQALLAEPRVSLTAPAPQWSGPLHCAAELGRIDMLKTLLKMVELEGGGGVNIQNQNQETPLHVAVRSNGKEAVKTLLAAPDIDANAQDEDGDTPLHAAAGMGNVAIIKILKDRAPHLDVNVRNHNGETPLHRAIICKKASAVATLLQIPQVDIHARDAEGVTPLAFADHFSRNTMIPELLRQHGATE